MFTEANDWDDDDDNDDEDDDIVDENIKAHKNSYESDNTCKYKDFTYSNSTSNTQNK